MSDPNDRKRVAREINRILKKSYPGAECALHYSSPLELLIATILSAQCTDQRVNQVTATLFRKYRTCEDYLNVPLLDLQQEIRSTGFFRNKAKSIQGACRVLLERFGGEVPRTLEELVELPGVARKTANVVLGVAFGVSSGIVVDTHVERLARRMGLTTEQRPDKIEADLMTLLPGSEWIDFSHRMITHGRRICAARKPLCDKCPVERLCPASLLKAERQEETKESGRSRKVRRTRKSVD